MAETYDALLIGAGPAGATAALTLARAGWKVAVVEKANFPRRKVCGEYLSPSNYALFRKLGIANDFLERAGFKQIDVRVVSREKQNPHFQTIFASAVK